MANYKHVKNICIVGYGRFGKTLHRLIKNDFIVSIYDIRQIKDRSEFTSSTVIINNVKDIYKGDVIFYAVPIDTFEKVLSSHKKFFQEHNLLIDILSVKIHPAMIFNKHIKDSSVQAMLTHPMFGPGSSKHGFEGLPIIVNQFKTDKANYDFWIDYFETKKLRVIPMSPREHDRLAANSQGLTHFTGRLLDSYGLKPTSIDSLGTKKLLEIKDQTCNDSWQLFTNLQHYNPYTSAMRIRLGTRYDELYNRLLPKQISKEYVTYGIQGGKGSFNEEALNYYLQRAGTYKYKVVYLYTSAAVLRALHAGKIDRGQFAIHNSTGGMVEESIKAMAEYKFKILDQYAIKISHALMIRADAAFSEITTIMTHPQVLAQCKQTLAQKYQQLIQTSGKGRMVDHAAVARDLGSSKLPKHVATMGSKVLAELYDLKIVEDNLQDLKENYTSFLLVE